MSAQEVGEIVPYQIVIDIPLSEEQNIIYDTIDIACGYCEKVITLGSQEKAIFDLNCEGKNVIQTFGTKQTTLKLYRDKNLIRTFQGGGYGENALFCYDFGSGNYTLEVVLTGTYNLGSTKLVITKFDNNVNDYREIFSIDYPSFYLYSYISKGNADINIFTPYVDGFYKFTVEPNDNVLTVYIIDPRSARATKESSDDSDVKDEVKITPSVYATNKEIKKILTVGIPYFIVIVNESHKSCNFDLYGIMQSEEEF